MKQKVRVWNVNTDKGWVKVATVEQGERQKALCEGCSAPCCKGIFRPILTEDEFLTKKFKITLIPAPDWLVGKVPDGTQLACIALNGKGCPYHDWNTNKCVVWPDCPKSCLSYDCREDPRMKEFVSQRFKNGKMS